MDTRVATEGKSRIWGFWIFGARRSGGTDYQVKVAPAVTVRAFA